MLLLLPLPPRLATAMGLLRPRSSRRRQRVSVVFDCPFFRIALFLI